MVRFHNTRLNWRHQYKNCKFHMYQYFEFKPTELLIKETIEEINNIVEDGLDEDEKKLIKRELGLLTRRVLNEVIELAGKLK